MFTFRVTLTDSLQFKREIFIQAAMDITSNPNHREKEMEARLESEGGLTNFGCRILKVEQMIQ